MDTDKKDETATGCCTKSRCCKGLAALALLLVGGAGGYLAGRCCAVKDAPAASAPAK